MDLKTLNPPGSPYPDPDTSSGVGRVSELRGANLRAKLDVIAVSGTLPTLDVTLDHSPDGTTWSELGVFSQASGVGSEVKVFGPAHRYVRPRWTIGGTGPSFRFSIRAENV